MASNTAGVVMLREVLPDVSCNDCSHSKYGKMGTSSALASGVMIDDHGIGRGCMICTHSMSSGTCRRSRIADAAVSTGSHETNYTLNRDVSNGFNFDWNTHLISLWETMQCISGAHNQRKPLVCIPTSICGCSSELPYASNHRLQNCRPPHVRHDALRGPL